jgi:hypothetical protein
MGRTKTNTGLPAYQAIRRGECILDRMESDGADFVQTDDTHAYLWHREQLVNLYDYKDLINFLTKHGYLKQSANNRMIVTATIIIEGLKRCN